MLTQESLAAKLGTRPFRFFSQVESTNDIARGWLLEGAPAGALVIADEQVKGRGRMGRFWLTPPGDALAMSVIVPGPLPGNAGEPLLMAAALAVAQTLDAYTSGVTLKWPNDVLISGRKVCGVLIETVWDGDQPRGAIVGIGVNVRVDFSGTGLEDRAVSLDDAAGQRAHRADLVAAIAMHLDAWLARQGRPDADELYKVWRSRLGMLGNLVTVHTASAAITGIAEDVEADGALLLRDAEGALHRIVVGDVEIGRT